MKNIINFYNENGYYIFKDVFTTNFCKELNDYLETLEIKRFIPYSDSPWGWGNLLDNGPFSEVTKNKILNTFCMEIFGSSNYVFPNMMVNNKAAWIGPDVEWHREIFNVDTYAPGYTQSDWKSFMNIYVALDKQTKENGCLMVYGKSHKIKNLNHEDMIDGNLGHKRRVKSEDMKLVDSSSDLVHAEMEVGDVLVFTHKTVHGSNTNKGPDNRKSIVLGARHNIKPINEEIYKQSTKYREDFIRESLQRVIDKIDGSLYADFNQDKK